MNIYTLLFKKKFGKIGIKQLVKYTMPPVIAIYIPVALVAFTSNHFTESDTDRGQCRYPRRDRRWGGKGHPIHGPGFSRVREIYPGDAGGIGSPYRLTDLRPLLYRASGGGIKSD